MNQKAARTIRRDIRRAFGPDALHAIEDINQRCADIAQSVSAVAASSANAAKEAKRHTDTLDALQTARSEPLTRGFAGRLKWLLTGK